MHSVLIPSLAGDTDSIFVSVALELEGIRAERLIGDNFPNTQYGSLFFETAKPFRGYLEEPSADHRVDLSDIDVVWLRRPRGPTLPFGVDPRDIEMARQENNQFIRSVYLSCWNNAVWVNPFAARQRANSKLLQLREAAEIGFRIPSTLVSNSPAEVRAFLADKSQQYIVKPIVGTDWEEDGRVFVTYTSSISLESLPGDAAISACACIYQRKVAKSFETRVVFFGAQGYAVKLNSQDVAGATIDWRNVAMSDLAVEAIHLPNEIHNFCTTLMSRLGIVHGSFDFAVDENGNWTFFEVNEAGQFLWLETSVPDLPILDTMVQFLAAPSSEFRYSHRKKIAKMSEVCRLPRFRELVELEQKNYRSQTSKTFI